MGFWGFGCCCGARLQLTVKAGCPTATPPLNVGATVTLKDAGGTVLESGATDASGVYLSTGSYAVGTVITYVIAQSGYQTLTGTRTMSSAAPNAVPATLLTNTTLHLSCGAATVTLTFNGGLNAWQGNQTVGGTNFFFSWQCTSTGSLTARSGLTNVGTYAFTTRSAGALMDTYTINWGANPTPGSNTATLTI